MERQVSARFKGEAAAASAQAAPLYDAAYLDDDLLEGPEARFRRRREAMLKAEARGKLLALASARRLARLGGSEPDLTAGS
jgi:hypothetical protein